MCLICRFLYITQISHSFCVSHHPDTKVCLTINLILGNGGISNILQV